MRISAWSSDVCSSDLGNTAAGTGPVSETRFQELGLALPDVPTPSANYVAWRRDGGLLVLAGQVCEWNGKVLYTGKVGRDLDLEAGQAAARICGLNLIAARSEERRVGKEGVSTG